jgi:hypothetical protein
MEILIVIAVIVGVIVLLKSGGKKNVDSLTLNEMVRHTKSLQNRIDQLSSIPNPSESVKAEIARKEAQWNYAMSVWKRKNEEASGS